jgi:ABC-type bacteriocin/lantibiotic exporter with double-glycine peptidase domain
MNNCGPASVATLLGYYDHLITQHDVNEEIPPGSVGGLDTYLTQFELMARAYTTPPALRPVRLLLANRIPVIVNQWLSIGSDIRHYRVIRGYDNEAQEFISDDPLQGPDMRIGYDDFMRLSNPGTIIPVYPPEMDALVQELMRGLWMNEVPV